MWLMSGFTRLVISITSMSAIYMEALTTGPPYIPERTSECPLGLNKNI